jgi:hemerythrin-like domain-containing protein
MSSQPSTVLPPAHQTMLLAHRAMVRDLERVAAAAGELAQSSDDRRAEVLREYVERVFQVIEHHHEGEDAYLWPLLRERGGDEEALALLEAEHEALSQALHAWHEASARLGSDPQAAADLAARSAEVHERLSEHAGDEERELAGRLAPALDAAAWKGFATHMRRTAPLWTLRFMPAWLASVAAPHERYGVPARPLARLFGAGLARTQREIFGAQS